MKSCIDKEPELEQKFRDALIERAGTMYVFFEVFLRVLHFLNKTQVQMGQIAV